MDEQTTRKHNMKLYPTYKMFGWDSLFYYAIIFLFLTQVKGFTASQVLIADSFYAFFRIFSQVFCVKAVDRIGKQKGLLLGNVLVSISMLTLILSKSFLVLIIYNLIEATGFSFKQVCEPTILADSIPKSSSYSKIYAKIDGKGSSRYYIFDAISSISTGFLYVLNPYIPLILCFSMSLFATILSLSFNDPNICKEKDTDKKQEKNDEESIGFKDIFSIFKQIVISNRLRSLLIFSLCLGGVLTSFGTLRGSIMVDVGIPEQYYGIVHAALEVVSAFSSKHQNWFNTKLKNRTLTWFSLSVVTSFIFTGLLVACNINMVVSIITVILTILIVGFVKGPYYTLMQRYLNSFTNPKVNTKIFAVDSMLLNLGRIIVSLFTSFLLGITTTAYSLIIIGCLFFIIFVFLLEYMKTKVGLNPKDYPEEDLVFATQSELDEIKQ